jgi:ribosomal protein L11 methylase PrmA
MIPLLSKTKHASSFRDPAGFIFSEDGALFRQVNKDYQPEYDHLMGSGLYESLVNLGLLIPHEEVGHSAAPIPELHYRTLKPQRVPFISYPYEWSFSQFKDAGLLTLEIQKQALSKGMSLKDCSAFNVQFLGSKPVFIDTLSFERYEEGTPWVAYRQFCQHFLAPLALMAYCDIRLGKLAEQYIDGIPLDLASKLLPGSTRLNFGLLTHIHLHAGSQKKHADKQVKPATSQSLSITALRGMIDSLESAVRKLEWQPKGTEWGDYYSATNYNDAAFNAKKQLVEEYLDAAKPQTVWDFGANTGVFSRIASNKGMQTVSFDIDPAAVEKNYRWAKEMNETNILPLLLDLTNPSPAIGWANTERQSVAERGPVNLLMALALIHHLAISNNLPFEKIAEYFSQLTGSLIIEFVPKSDSQVQRLLATRKDIFNRYHQQSFEEVFSQYFYIEQSAPIPGSERTLYLMRSK